MKIFSSVFLSTLLIMPMTSMAKDVESADVTAAKEAMLAKILKVQDQLDNLVDQGGKYVYLQLAQKNSLSPFAVGISDHDEVVMLEVPKSEAKANVADKVLALREMLKLGADTDKFVATALFVQAQVPFEGTTVDGVAIEMEHAGGLSVLRFSPYRIDRDNKKIAFLKPVDKEKPLVFFKDVIEKNNNKKS